MIASASITAVHVGPVAPLGPSGVPSGYRKTAIAGPVVAGRLGLVGDAQGDLRVHGGPDKAVYGYDLGCYARWAEELPDLAGRFVAGSMGENLIVAGANERSLCIGDRVRAGTALLQITQIREPCFKLGLAFDDARLLRAMIRNGRCGWYYRVLEDGAVAAGDAHDVIDRPNPDWPVARFAELVAARAFGTELLIELVALEGLAENWKLRALKQLAVLRAVPR